MAEIIAVDRDDAPIGSVQSGGQDNGRCAVIKRAGRIWAIGAVHGEASRLAVIHDAVADRLHPTDRIVYLGEFLGYGPDVGDAVDEILRFRSAFLARAPLVHPDDILCLRGQQEEIWHKLLQLQFAVNPAEVLEWALCHGAEATLRAYGGDAATARVCARGGPLALTRWTGAMREAMRRRAGHVALMSSLRRAAWTDSGSLLFVSAGIDPTRPVAAQTDGFWWESGGFDAIDQAYAGYRTVIRGFDPRRRGFAATPWTVTIDGGCGFGGPLMALCLSADGEILDRLEA